jgi:hypothetical protein
MAVKRRGRSRTTAVNLSFDSLIDVFMNVLGVLMITAVVMALAVPGDVSSPKPTPPTPPSLPTLPAPPRTASPRVRLSLPQVKEATTDSLFVLVTEEGIRPFSSDPSSIVQNYFSITDLGGSLRLEVLPGRVMDESSFRGWLRTFSPDERHVTAAVTPGGAKYYREVRRVAEEEGFRSGWLEQEEEVIVIGSEGGRTGSLVQ